MNIETKIRNRVAAATAEIKEIETTSHHNNYLIFGDEQRVQLALLTEIKYLLWVLDEAVPRDTIDIIGSMRKAAGVI